MVFFSRQIRLCHLLDYLLKQHEHWGPLCFPSDFFFFLSNVSTFLPLFPLRIIFGLCEHPKHYMYLKKKKTSQSFNQHTGEKSSLGLKAICAFKRSTNSPLTARTASSQTKCLPVMSRCASSALPAHTSFIQVREEAISFISAGNYFLIYGAWVFT